MIFPIYNGIYPIVFRKLSFREFHMKRRHRLPRKPLEDALFLINAAQQVLLRLTHDPCYVADDGDFPLLEKISDICIRTRLMAYHTEICLHKRAKGEPEPPLPEA